MGNGTNHSSNLLKKGAPLEAFPETEMVPIGDLKPHPKNYREHPEDQLEHLRESIRSNGFYRNVVIANDSTILAGHGITEAMNGLKHDQVPCYRLDIDPDSPQALKILAGDNMVSNMGHDNDYLLAQVLESAVQDDLSGLLGTGISENEFERLLAVDRRDFYLNPSDGEVEEIEEIQTDHNCPKCGFQW